MPKIIGKSHWPKELDLPLLGAALTEERERAKLCWTNWRSQTTLDDCEYQLHRLLPLVFRRFEGGGMDAADLNLLRGVYRYYWTRNQLRLPRATRCLEALQGAGVEVLVLRGLAMAYLYFPDPGTCPEQELELLIRPEQRTLALQVLQQLGWRLDSWPGDPSITDRCALQQDDGQLLTLRWYACEDCRWHGVDAAFWQRSREFRIHQLTARTLCPSDMLLLTCLRRGADSIGWLMDAGMLLLQPIDWTLFLEEARQRRVIPPTLEGLTGWQQIPGFALPQGLLTDLRSTPLSWVDRCYFSGRPGWLLPYLDYQRGGRPGGFLQYLRRRWGLPRIRSIPGRLAQWLYEALLAC